MGKAKKHQKSRQGDAVEASGALDDQLERSSLPPIHNRSKIKKKSAAKDNEEYLDSSLSAKILKEARKQQQELEAEEQGGPSVSETQKEKQLYRLTAPKSDDEEEDLPSDEDLDDGPVEVDEEEEAALEKFMSSEPVVRRTLADLIQEKIASKQAEVESALSDGMPGMEVRELDPRLVGMYRGVQEVLSTYRSGKLPKAFKVIPKMVNWEQILALTEPPTWTPAAMYQATRIFASNLNAKMCQRFLNLVLLPCLREHIGEHKKLNFHLYQALKKALFKPGAFFKGILLPLCESRTCTLREATIVGSVVTKCTIPMLHTAAAMLKLAEMDYTGPNSLFLRLLIDKKYTLPFRVVDALVFHFLRFETDKRQMHVLWHQCLLSLVQRYKEDMSGEQRERLLELLKVHHHHQIGPEVRRELNSAQSRDMEDLANAVGIDLE